MKRLLFGLSLVAIAAAAFRALPVDAQAAAPAPPVAYSTFIQGGTLESGFIPLLLKGENVYFVLSPDQLGHDFIETSVPSSGSGGDSVGGPQGGIIAPSRIFRFERMGNRIVMRWPNFLGLAKPSSAEALGLSESMPNSVLAVLPIVATDAATGTIVVSASPFLGDLANIQHQLGGTATPNAYHLDDTKAFFGRVKAFPENDVIRVDQTWASANPPSDVDAAADARSIEIVVTYNILPVPEDGYVPRISDPRVGYFSLPQLDFEHDSPHKRNVYYICRWNFEPEHPGQLSVATHPIVFYLSDGVPVQYRSTIRDALLVWNEALRKVGILNGIQVAQQPNDPNWDPEDIRHNMIRWIYGVGQSAGAEALLVTDPRTGEELNVGVNINADSGDGWGGGQYRYLIAPARGLPDSKEIEHAMALKMLHYVVLHESGHDLGLQHNFISQHVYTAKNLQSTAFTEKYGLATSVMGYIGLNLWPKGTPQGDYYQAVLGPYDYYAIKYGYGYIPNVSTPEQELSTLNQWASAWTNPMYRFASDEDTMFYNGHAIDPRVSVFILTNDMLGWCAVQQPMYHRVLDDVGQRFPARGQAWDEARQAFTAGMQQYQLCPAMPARWIGGEYLSRALPGDPGATRPLTVVSRKDEEQAWHYLGSWLFSDAAWRFNPSALTLLTYSEYSWIEPISASWAANYDTAPPRHDISIPDLAAQKQDEALSEMFAPLTLQRIDELSFKYPAGATMTLTDLFDWSRASIFGDIASGSVANAGVVRRNLQTRFARLLGKLWTSPDPGTPGDAAALAHLQLVYLERDANAALARGKMNELTQAHLQALVVIAKQSLEARVNVAAPPTQ